MLPYEEFFKESNFSVARAEEILTAGWTAKGYPPIPLDNIPWENNDPLDRTLAFLLHSLNIIETLLRAYSHTHDVRFLTSAVPAALDWCRQSANSTSVFLWDGMAAALRAHRLAFILEAAEEESLLHAEEKELLWQQLLRHRVFLSDDANIDFHNNHGYFQIACQIAMGRRLQTRAPEMLVFMKQGKARMHAIIQQQFTGEYIHKENSPAYFKLVYETLKIIVESGLMPELKSNLLHMEEALSCFVMPNQHLAMLGRYGFYISGHDDNDREETLANGKHAVCRERRKMWTSPRRGAESLFRKRVRAGAFCRRAGKRLHQEQLSSFQCCVSFPYA